LLVPGSFLVSDAHRAGLLSSPTQLLLAAPSAHKALQRGGLLLRIEGDARAGPEGGALLVATRAGNTFYLLPKPRLLGYVTPFPAFVHGIDQDGALL
jgi:hypothetical protein